jgi:hypothetical protein
MSAGSIHRWLTRPIAIDAPPDGPYGPPPLTAWAGENEQELALVLR